MLETAKPKKPRKPKAPKKIVLIREDGTLEDTSWKTMKEITDWAKNMKYQLESVGDTPILSRPTRIEYVKIENPGPGELPVQPREVGPDKIIYAAQ